MPPRLSFDPNISQADLHNYYFPAFTDVVAAGVRSIMCSYNGINGYPMCMSPLLKSVLREQMQFDGYIVTDSGAIDFMVRQLRHHFGPSLKDTWARYHHPTHAVGCVLLGCHAYWMPVGACDPML